MAYTVVGRRMQDSITRRAESAREALEEIEFLRSIEYSTIEIYEGESTLMPLHSLEEKARAEERGGRH